LREVETGLYFIELMRKFDAIDVSLVTDGIYRREVAEPNDRLNEK